MKIVFIIPPAGKLAKKFLAPTMSVAILAALTPDNFHMTIIDGNIESVDFNCDCQLVAITVSTTSAAGAFEIADKFRSRGVKVIMGGVHPTVRPDECLKHADSVCIGEAELIWNQILNDFKSKKLKKIYKAQRQMDPIILPSLNRGLFNKRGYLVHNTVLTSRGCPNNCDFCIVRNLYGTKYRLRKVDDVVEEIRALKPGPKPVVFVDDNIVGDTVFAKKLFKALIPLKIRWMSQCSLTIAEDDELLDLAAKSGCKGLFIGFESIFQGNLNFSHKNINKVENYFNTIQKIKRKNIFIHGAFILGFDGDDETVFEKTLRFAMEMKLEVANFGILTPYPGTLLFERLQNEGRIFDYNWSHYDSAHVVFRPKNMSPSTLQKEQYNIMKEFYSLSSVIKRIGIFASPFLWILNFAHRNVVKELWKIAQ